MGSTKSSIGSVISVLSVGAVSAERKLLTVDAKELSADNCVRDWPSGSNETSDDGCEQICPRGPVGFHFGGLS